MKKALGKWFKVQPEEAAVFFWAALLLFLIRNSNILFNNFAETAFLKRFGVEYLPMVYVANSLVTFFIMGLMAGVMKRLPSARLLTFMLMACGGLVASLRLVVGMNFDLIYPVLFLLKAQFEMLLALVFWNLANDLFNTRQSKRIFPLITAGGVIGAIIGSFGTPWLARLIHMNNLMLAYLVSTSLAALVVWRMSILFPTLPLSERKAKPGKKRVSLKDEIKQVLPLIKESTLVKILILITFLPNVVIPILNYQFNFAVNETYATEGGLIAFFGYFRGVLNIISLVILLFVGKLYSRWGLPAALMFHPCNYVLAFLALFFRFDVFSAMYARLSTRVIRMTINGPARDILMGLFPPEYRPLLRPFLRGVVVRVALLLGSGFIMLFEGVLHPKYLSLVGVFFGSLWIAANVWLKRAYSGILLELISQKVLDMKSLEEKELGGIFQDKRAQKRLVETCLNSEGPACVLYAEMMKTYQAPGWEDHLFTLIRRQDEDTVCKLLSLAPPTAGAKALETYRELVGAASPKLAAALAQAASKLPPEVSAPFLEDLMAHGPSLEVKAWAAAGLYEQDPEHYHRTIRAWLESDDPEQRRAGVIAAGGSGASEFISRLREMLAEADGDSLNRRILIALHGLGDPGLRELLLERLIHDPSSVPLEVLEEFEVDDYQSTDAFIHLLGSERGAYRELAERKLRQAPELDVEQVIHALALPNRRIRKGLFALMKHLKISDRHIVDFTQAELERAYRNLAEAEAVKVLAGDPFWGLLRDHLKQKKDVRVDSVLRVLAAQDDSDRMRIVQRGLDSSDARLRSNAVEAVESLVGRKLAAAMIPLLESLNTAETLATGRKLFKLGEVPTGADDLLRYFLAKRDPITLSLALSLAAGRDGFNLDEEDKARLTGHDVDYVRTAALRLVGADAREEAQEMEAAVSLPDKIILLRQMEIFEGLSVSELGAVAAVCQEETRAPGEEIIREGEMGETMYLVVSGKVAVSKIGDDGCGMNLGYMTDGEYFGEMALFDDQVRSASVTAVDQTRLLVLHKREFAETVREYPQVALQICRELSRRVRELHQKIKGLPLCELKPSQG